MVGVGSTTVTVPILVAVGTGFAMGAALGRIIHQHHAQRLKEQLERGGLLLWVNVRNQDEERSAMTVLKAHDARELHTHSIVGRS